MFCHCAIIDYERAFDMVIHKALWMKLKESCISCNIDYQSNRKSWVKNTAVLPISGMLNISIGVKKAEPLSSIIYLICK
jgi:hypothetical protein